MPVWCDCVQAQVDPTMCGGCDDPHWDDGDESCDHEEYEIDVLTGRASCDRCPAGWWATPEQIEAEAQRQRVYAEWVADQERPLARFKDWARGILRRHTRPARKDIDDDLPF